MTAAGDTRPGDTGSERGGPPTRAVLFDFGGTLFSYRGMSGGLIELIVEAAERVGAEVEAAEAVRLFGKASWSSIRDHGPEPYYLHRDLFTEGHRRFLASIGAEADDAFYDWLYEEQRRRMVEGHRLRESCLPTLERLRDADLHLGIVSNIDDDHLHPMVEQNGLAEVLHAWTSSEEARSCKPDPGIFHHAVAKTGLGRLGEGLDPAAVLFVGDSLAHDVAGARALGMRTALIREEESMERRGADDALHADVEPDHVLADLDDLLAILGLA